MHTALIKFVESPSSLKWPFFVSEPRLGCCAMMATLRSDPFAVVARVVFRFCWEACEPLLSTLDGVSVEELVVLSPDCERYGFEVKKCRLRGRVAGVVMWKNRRGRGPKVVA